MRITYSILWFDDTEEYFESLDLDPLKDAISSWGFKPIITLVTEPDEFMGYEPFNSFDLIVVDYNLEVHETHGQIFIKKIREHDVFTEVVFYSANPSSELWDAVRDKELEGVFVATRGGVTTKIEKVAYQSVRKVLDLENVRGIVMAEVGSIDNLLDKIIHTAASSLNEADQKLIFDKYQIRLQEQINSRVDRVTDVVSGMISDLLPHCDSNKKWNLLCSMAKKHPDIDRRAWGDYAATILSPRNFLAHGTAQAQDDGSLLFIHNGKDYRYDDTVSADLRKKLQAYYEMFDSVLITLTK